MHIFLKIKNFITLFSLLFIFYISSMMSISYYFEIPWPCGIENYLIWAYASCGFKLLNFTGYVFLGIPPSLIVMIISFICMIIYFLTDKYKLYKFLFGILFLCSLFMEVKIRYALGSYSAQSLLVLIVSLTIFLLHIWSNKYIPKNRFSILINSLLIFFVLLLVTVTYKIVISKVPDIINTTKIDKISFNKEAIKNNDKNVLFYGNVSEENGILIFTTKNCPYTPFVLDSTKKLKNVWVAVITYEKGKILEGNPNIQKLIQELEINSSPIILSYNNGKLRLLKRRDISYYY
jgi:FlaA1/EpsC-like NDP-sugar epimerase